MKHGWLRRTLILLIACGLCFGMFRYSRESPPPRTARLTLWYLEADCGGAAMDRLLDRCLRETGIQIEAVAFSDEEAMGTAFEEDMPDLLFCSHLRAAPLEGRGALAEIAEPLPVPAALAERLPPVGRSFFPIGSRLPVLLVNTALPDAAFDSLDALLEAAGESPFLGCDCLAAFLYAELAAQGLQLTGLPERDLDDPHVAAVYNALALAAFRGGLVCAEDAAAYVRQGLLPCAVTMSTALAGLTERSLDVRALPLPAGARAQYPAELLGFAVLDGADTQTAGTFAQWLWGGGGTETALEAGLLPFVQTEAAGESSEIGNRLRALGGTLSIFLLDAGEPFVQNRALCERWLREALDLLT